MRKSSWAALGLIFVLVGVVAYLKFWLQAPSDEEQIRALLARGEAAIERRDLRDAFACVSRDYSDPAGFTYATLRLQAMRMFYEADGYDVAVEILGIQVDGDTAEVNADVSVTALIEDESHAAFAGPLTIELKKEDAKRCLIIPTRVWKITSISVLPTAGGYQVVSRGGRTCRYDERQIVHVALHPVAVPPKQGLAGRPIVGKAYVRQRLSAVLPPIAHGLHPPLDATRVLHCGN